VTAPAPPLPPPPAEQITVPSAHDVFDRSRGPLVTHESTLSHPVQPAPSVNPSGTDNGPPTPGTGPRSDVQVRDGKPGTRGAVG